MKGTGEEGEILWFILNGILSQNEKVKLFIVVVNAIYATFRRFSLDLQQRGFLSRRNAPDKVAPLSFWVIRKTRRQRLEDFELDATSKLISERSVSSSSWQTRGIFFFAKKVLLLNLKYTKIRAIIVYTNIVFNNNTEIERLW